MGFLTVEFEPFELKGEAKGKGHDLDASQSSGCSARAGKDVTKFRSGQVSTGVSHNERSLN